MTKVRKISGNAPTGKLLSNLKGLKSLSAIEIEEIKSLIRSMLTSVDRIEAEIRLIKQELNVSMESEVSNEL